MFNTKPHPYIESLNDGKVLIYVQHWHSPIHRALGRSWWKCSHTCPTLNLTHTSSAWWILMEMVSYMSNTKTHPHIKSLIHRKDLIHVQHWNSPIHRALGWWKSSDSDPCPVLTLTQISRAWLMGKFWYKSNISGARYMGVVFFWSWRINNNTRSKT